MNKNQKVQLDELQSQIRNKSLEADRLKKDNERLVYQSNQSEREHSALKDEVV